MLCPVCSSVSLESLGQRGLVSQSTSSFILDQTKCGEAHAEQAKRKLTIICSFFTFVFLVFPIRKGPL